MIRSKTTIAIPPGETIKEQLFDRGINIEEFATKMGMNKSDISSLIDGELQLTPDIAIRLERALGLPSQFWINLENIYRDKLSKIRAETKD